MGKRQRFKTMRAKRSTTNEDDFEFTKASISIEERFFLYLLSGFMTVGDIE